MLEQKGAKITAAEKCLIIKLGKFRTSAFTRKCPWDTSWMPLVRGDMQIKNNSFCLEEGAGLSRPFGQNPN